MTHALWLVFWLAVAIYLPQFIVWALDQPRRPVALPGIIGCVVAFGAACYFAVNEVWHMAGRR